MRAVYPAMMICFATGVACVGQAVAQTSPRPPAAATPPRPAAPLVAEQLEQAGLTSEAATEALRALPAAPAEERTRYLALLGRVRERGRTLDAERRRTDFTNRLALADDLSRRGMRDDALRVYIAAAESATSSDDRKLALDAAERVAAIRFVDRGSPDRIWTALRTIIDNGAGALIVAAALGIAWFLGGRPALSALESHRRGTSDRAVIKDFQDSTATGLGRGLPALIRTIYQEQQQLEQASPGGSVLMPYIVPGGLPLLSAPAAETDFTWIGLSVAGTPVKDVLARWSAAWNAPWSTTTGTIYQFNQDVRVSLSISTHGEPAVGWDASLQEGVTPPRDAAYRVLFTILDQWERRNG